MKFGYSVKKASESKHIVLSFYNDDELLASVRQFMADDMTGEIESVDMPDKALGISIGSICMFFDAYTQLIRKCFSVNSGGEANA